MAETECKLELTEPLVQDIDFLRNLSKDDDFAILSLGHKNIDEFYQNEPVIGEWWDGSPLIHNKVGLSVLPNGTKKYLGHCQLENGKTVSQYALYHSSALASIGERFVKRLLPQIPEKWQRTDYNPTAFKLNPNASLPFHRDFDSGNRVLLNLNSAETLQLDFANDRKPFPPYHFSFFGTHEWHGLNISEDRRDLLLLTLTVGEA